MGAFQFFGVASDVAQVSNLLYRSASSLRGARTPCRLEIGDTAGWKPALLFLVSNRYQEH
ncbi:MAG: hypothetical protein C5B50_29070 [Verrucomicrobia bacterium]|nr:MAG: hypothetical protein C5B50_29070 [Verrucomicrobiota bacterium]